jgi:type II secretory pathway pseudopilin PulG
MSQNVRCPLRPAQSCSTSRRTAKSLVEMLVLMLILNVVVALSATTLIGAMRAEQQVRRGTVQHRALAQLSSRFRSDAHRAASCQVAETCEFTIPGGETIRYTHSAPRITREIRRGDEVTHRDSYVLGDAVLVSFEMPESAGGSLVRLRVVERPGSARPLLASTRRVVIEAGIGSSNRAAVEASNDAAREDSP